MLTAYQCEVAAFVIDGGIICRDCAIERLDRGELGDATPLIRYSLDEEQTAQAEGWLDWDYEAEEIRETEDGRFALIHGRWHAEGCACAPAVYCDDDYSHELVEEYVDYTCRGDDEPVPNPAVPRWVPCSRCGAGDGQPHREGCGYLES